MDENRDLWKPPADYLPKFNRPTLTVVAEHPQAQTSSISGEMALHRAKLLFGCYRRDEAADPEIYVMAAASVLAMYDEQIVVTVTDPRYGLPSKTKFVPQISEIKEACEHEAGRRARYQELGRLKPAPPLPQPMIPPGEDAFSMDQKYGRPIGFFERVDDKWNKHVVSRSR